MSERAAFTLRVLSDAWDAGYEHASGEATSKRGIHAADCRDLSYLFSECNDARVRDWTEDDPGFYRVFAAYRAGFRAYLNDRGGVWRLLAPLIRTDDPAWLLGPEPVEVST